MQPTYHCCCSCMRALLTYVCKRVHTSIHNPDSDDSFYPFANQWYMSREKGENRKKEGKKKHTSCWSVNRTGAELSSPFHTPLQPSRHNKVPILDPQWRQQRFWKTRLPISFFFFVVVLLSAQPAPFCSQLHSAPSPHFPPISLVNVGHSSHMSHSLNSTEFVSTTKSRESVCRGRKRGRKKEKKACECQWKERQRQDWKP